MSGWSTRKRETVEQAFYAFLNRCYIDSKDHGRICLGENLYWGQIHAITCIFDALENDIHDIYFLKARQLGISTIVRALTVFFLGIHKGLKGALVFDTAPNRDEARTELVSMIRNLPASLKFPKVKGSGEGNREGLTLENDSRILFKSAGVKKSKSSGTLGRSVGLAFATLSELCSYDNDEGMESFEQSLSDVNPDRLYVRESTARGFNSWHTMWTEAREDTTHKRCVFLGFWSKEGQRIDRSEPDFLRYGVQPPTEKELERIVAVRERYHYEVSQEQLAWYRRKMDPTVQREGDEEVEFEGSTTRIQEQPWCVTREMRVGTQRGVLRIEDVREGDVTARGRVLKSGVTGQTIIWKARTKLGYQIRGTGNHPLIETGDQQVRLDSSFHRKVRLQPPRFAEQPCYLYWTEGVFNISVNVTPTLARFVGLFMGDGSASHNRAHGGITEVSICCDAKDKDVVAECVRLFKELFGVNATENAYKGWITVRSGTRVIFDTVKKLGLTRNDTVNTKRRVHVPEFIWRSPKEVVREFLCGLFEADGFNAYDTNRVAFFSAYPDFARDVQILLLMFGITSRNVSAQKKAGSGHFYTGNQLELRTLEAIRFNEEIGFISSRKRARYKPERDLSGRKRFPIAFEDTVVSVENEGVVEEVFNLTVEGEHLFDANGILTHNTEDEAFQNTGSQFFPAEKLTEQSIKCVKGKFDRYTFSPGITFQDMQISIATTAKWTDLKVWQEPDPDGVYILSCDPAFGENENNDRSAIEVGRCYADGIDQVAEYASPLPTPQQLAWILASLMGWYGGEKAEVKYILELNGPGKAVFNELKQLKFQLENGYQRQEIEEKGLRNVFRNVRTFIYSRPDSIMAGQNFHFLTSLQLKIMVMNHLRDYVNTQLFRVRSAELVEEMRSITQEGDTIKAPGIKKDDRAFASALLCYYWQSNIRKQLITQNRTRDAEAAKRALTIADQVSLFQQNQLQAFFDQKRKVRIQQAAQQSRLAWRYGRR